MRFIPSPDIVHRSVTAVDDVMQPAPRLTCSIKRPEILSPMWHAACLADLADPLDRPTLRSATRRHGLLRAALTGAV